MRQARRPFRIFDTRQRKRHVYFRFCGVSFFRIKQAGYPRIQLDDPALPLDLSSVDAAIAHVVEADHSALKNCHLAQSPINERVAFLATELYDTGGHTECLKNIVSALHGVYDMGLFLSRVETTVERSANKFPYIKQRCHTCSGVEFQGWQFSRSAIRLYNQIVQFRPKAILVLMHMDDSLAAAVLHLIRTRTAIRILYFNHGSHYPALGFSFSHVSLECMVSTERVTREERHFSNCVRVPLPSGFASDSPVYTTEVLRHWREKMGLSEGRLCTVSGGAAYKFFSGSQSVHLEMIRNLLLSREDFEHLWITDLNDEQRDVVQRVFSAHPHLLSRLKITPLTPDYLPLFSLADVFIDSFPVGAALTHIDLMRLKVPMVVKINRDNPKFSFHEYMPADYPYMTDSVQELERHIDALLADPLLRHEIAESNHAFYLSHYEGHAVRERFRSVIERECGQN